MLEFKTERIIAELSNTGNTAKRLTLTKWGNYPAKLDLRIWRKEDGELKPGRGMTLNTEEAEALAEALNSYLA